ncbi:maleylacetoacetate isomerase [Roseibium aggregatum]|uniref:maleylacetoacetate isomerase n=1 Tax=Roseibium aggregatum TaxID=187304 RepID=UPI0002DC0E41|nr:maleylacetoacetate isomerase [Roseibium aggregatum]
MAKDIVLYDYWRSSASYRVRIALNLLKLEAEYRPVNLLTRAHLDDDYLALNPQGLLPALIVDGKTLTQSLAIIEYLHATTPGSTLMPEDVDGQYRVRQLSYAIAMEIHPVCNLGIVGHVAELTGGGDDAKKAWMQRFIGKGLAAFETLLDDNGPFCHGDTPTMADCCLMPQLYNANRWGVDVSGFPKILRVAAAAEALDAFKDAHPDAIGAPPA